MHRTPYRLLCATFLLCVYGVPISQAIFDITDDEPPQVLELFEQAPSEKNLRQFEQDLESNSFFEELGRGIYQYASHLAMGDVGDKATAGVGDWLYYTPALRYLSQPYFRVSAPPADPTQDPVETVVHFAEQLATHDIELLVIPIPSKASVYPDRLVSSLPADAQVFDNTMRLAAELNARGVKTFDLHAVLREARQAEPNTRLFMQADTHWTCRGAQIAGEAVAEHLLRTGLATRSKVSKYVRRPVGALRYGDVAEMTKILWRESLFASETVTCQQVRAADTHALYRDEDNAEILWLGDSFSRVFERDAPKSAGWAAQVAFMLQQPLATIINDGGASTLVRQQLARRVDLLDDKKLVIWAFAERDVRFGLQGWQRIDLWPSNP